MTAPAATSTRRRARRRFNRTNPLLVNALRLAVLVAFLLLWERFAGPRDDPSAFLDEFYVSKPSAIWRSITSWLDQGILFSSIAVTLQEAVWGLLIGTGLGLVAGFSLGVSPLLSAVLKPYVTALNSIPRLALVPLFLLWFGLGISSKLALVATIVFFLVFYSTYAGVQDVEQELIDVVRLMGARRIHVHAKVTLPSAMKWIIEGLRVSVPYSLVAAVTAEMIASNRGMGFLLIRSSGQFNTAGVFGAIVVLMCVSVVLSALVSLLERYLLRWKPRNLRR
ncbi:MAG: ABC transporter permease [Acidimicrobiia bacterium]